MSRYGYLEKKSILESSLDFEITRVNCTYFLHQNNRCIFFCVNYIKCLSWLNGSLSLQCLNNWAQVNKTSQGYANKHNMLNFSSRRHLKSKIRKTEIFSK